MANEPNPDGTADWSAPGEQPDTTPEPLLVASLPDQETEQRDPAQLSAGHMGVGSIALAALAASSILGVVLYGLNSGGG